MSTSRSADLNSLLNIGTRYQGPRGTAGSQTWRQVAMLRDDAARKGGGPLWAVPRPGSTAPLAASQLEPEGYRVKKHVRAEMEIALRAAQQYRAEQPRKSNRAHVDEMVRDVLQKQYP